MPVAPSQPADAEAILAVARRAEVFDSEEVGTVAELFSEYVRDADGSGYYFLSYREAGTLLGFACWGPASLSQGAADLYWICTAPEAQNRGVATALFRAVEEAVRRAGRWLILIWTSSQPSYQAARSFYLRMGCTLAAQIEDYYARGDDLFIYERRL